MTSIKAKILKYKPHKVTVELPEKGTTVNIPRGVFDRRIEVGIYDVINAEVLPKFL